MIYSLIKCDCVTQQPKRLQHKDVQCVVEGSAHAKGLGNKHSLTSGIKT